MGVTSKRSSNDLKCIFVCDFYKVDLNNKGGAENNDSVLISLLEKYGFKIERTYSKNISPQFIEANKNKKFIIGNFVQLSEASKASLADKHYIVYEHDHKYLKTRDPSRFPNFLAPKDQLVNEEFYKNSKCVICLSNSQTDSIKKNLEISNVESIGCSLWSTEKLDFIADIADTVKEKDYCVINSRNLVKGTSQATDFCRRGDYSFDLIESNNEKEFLKTLASYKTLVYMPTVLESLCRLVVEAKMLNCGVLTKTQLLGAASESWWGLNGKELITAIKSQQDTAFNIFLKYLLN